MSAVKKGKAAPFPSKAPEGQEAASWELSPWLVVLAAVVPFAAYLWTLAPSVGGGDSGELTTVAVRLGIAHPPGYPLYTVLGWLFSWLPVGSEAWRQNLFSAVCNSVASLFLFAAVRLWSQQGWAALLSALLFALSPLVWRYATTAEVFGLHHVFVAGLLYGLVRYAQAPSAGTLRMAALWLGLGMSNHQTLLFYGLPIVLWVLLVHPRRRAIWNTKELLTLVACFAAGLFPYVYLWLRAPMPANLGWGETSTLAGFWGHLTRRDYGTLRLGASEYGTEGHLVEALRAYFRELPQQTLSVAGGLGAYGIFIFLRKEGWRGAAAVTCFIYIFYLVVFHSMVNLNPADEFNWTIQSRFWTQANLLVCAWAGLGWAAVLRGGRRRRWRFAGPLVVAVAALMWSGGRESQRNNRVFELAGREILEPLPPGALLFASGDSLFNAVRFQQEVLGLRRDVTVSARELMGARWYHEALHRLPGRDALRFPAENVRPTITALLQGNLGRVPVFALNLTQEDRDTLMADGFELWPLGWTEQILPKGEGALGEALVKRSLELLDQSALKAFPVFRRGSEEHRVALEHWKAEYRVSSRLMTAPALVAAPGARELMKRTMDKDRLRRVMPREQANMMQMMGW